MKFRSCSTVSFVVLLLLSACDDSNTLNEEPGSPLEGVGGEGGKARKDTDPNADTSPKGPDVAPGELSFCEVEPEGTMCGDRRACRERVCVFTVPDAACDFDFQTIQADDFLVIGCDHDLAGAEIVLPEGVVVEYNGGSITNGKMDVREASIAPELLNLSLNLVTGSDGEGSLTRDTFDFEPSQWDMESGTVSDAVALDNKAHLMRAINQVSRLRGKIFRIGKLDVFVDVVTPVNGLRDIRLPSHFHLAMSHDTHLRVQPNNSSYSHILGAEGTDGTHISGGHLWGDRFTHDYAGDDGPTDQGLGIYVGGADNMRIEDLSANEFIGDGIVVGPLVPRNDDGTPQKGRPYAENITIRDCVFDSNRRNGLALVDVEGALLDGVTVTNTAQGSRDIDGPSAGVSPRWGIQIEPIQPLGDDGELRLLEIVTDVVIRNSSFSNNYAGDLNLFKCNAVEIYNNTFGGGVGSVVASDVEIHDNTFVADSSDRLRAIHAAPKLDADGAHRVFDWSIRDNKIEGFTQGISIGGRDQRIEGNEISECERGFFLLGGKDNTLANNVIQSSKPMSSGYGHFARINLTGVIRGGSVSVVGQPFAAVDLNQDLSAGRLTVSDVLFNSTSGKAVSFVRSQRVTMSGCTADGYSERDSDVVLNDNITR